ncbi:DUF6218 family protein [Actinosynnema sp. NPDC023794]
MIAAPREHGSLGLPPTRAGDGRTMIGHVIVRRAGSGHDDAIAVWHLDTEGSRTGAWVKPTAMALTESGTARSLLNLCRQKALLDWDPAEAVKTLGALEEAAGDTRTDWAACAVTIPELLAEVADIRASYAKRVAEEKATKKNIVDLEWAIDLPDPLPSSVDHLERLAGFGELIAPTEAATEALRISRLGGWVVQRWRETALALGRTYLRASFGPPTVLAPKWEARLADAHAHRW